MDTETKIESKTIATAECGDTGYPGESYWFAKGEMRITNGRFEVRVSEEYGSNQGYLEKHGGNRVRGRGDSPESAVETIYDDVMSWKEDQMERELRGMLRDLTYDAEDALVNEETAPPGAVDATETWHQS